MLFSSIPFIILFLPVTLLLYYCCPSIKVKNIILLIMSIIFYAWGEPKFVLIMLISILVNYGMGLLIGGTSFSIQRRKLFLVLGLCVNLLILFVFKYLGFTENFINSLINLFNLKGFQLTVHQFVLPLGISFYTFQSMSYLIDVYRTPVLAQRNPLDLGLFISFFPQLIAGPIVRYHDINEQIKKRTHSADLFAQGIERFIVGLAKKALIANTLAEVVDGILSLPPQSVPSIYMLLAIVCGALQIYYDFSGYSDMAIGLGRMFGFKIMENFNYPFAAGSLTEFWRRWHISLSTWFRDYLFVPLGGSRKGSVRQLINILIVFTLVGLWHGASYNFIFFGFINGIIIIFERRLKEKQNLSIENNRKSKAGFIINSIFSHIGVFIIIILFFIYFRLDIHSSLLFYKNFFNFAGKVATPLDILILTDTRFYIILFFALAFSFPWWRKWTIPVNKITVIVKYAALLILFVLSFGTLATDAYNPFIYFRF